MRRAVSHGAVASACVLALALVTGVYAWRDVDHALLVGALLASAAGLRLIRRARAGEGENA